MDVVLSINLITSNPKVRGGRPCIAGTGLRVTDIIMASIFQMQTTDELAMGFGISLAQVHAAFAYYYEHQAEFDVDIRAQIAQSRADKEQHIANGNRPLLSNR
jgi:uncharacterized protein (DUF433 family)